MFSRDFEPGAGMGKLGRHLPRTHDQRTTRSSSESHHIERWWMQLDCSSKQHLNAIEDGDVNASEPFTFRSHVEAHDNDYDHVDDNVQAAARKRHALFELPECRQASAILSISQRRQGIHFEVTSSTPRGRRRRDRSRGPRRVT